MNQWLTRDLQTEGVPVANGLPSELVYFIQGRRTKLIKIGVARNVERRLRSLQTGAPEELTLLGVIRRDDPGQLERDLHHRFSYAHSRGEWFEPAAALTAYIEENAVSREVDDEHRFNIIAMQLNGFAISPGGEISLTETKPPVARPRMRGRTVAERIRSYKEARGLA